MITLNTCHAVHPPYGILKCPAGRGQPQFLKHFPRRDAPRTVVMGPSGRLARKRCCADHLERAELNMEFMVLDDILP